jgi:glycosyltransferase involved in cell wall biosynthesis
VVTPSFNQGRYIRATIESVLGQNYPNLEYWVIDGGSSDETIDVLRSYTDDARFNWISECDRGQSDAINKGWRRCRGDILAWLNSDDLYHRDAIFTQVNALLAAPQCGAVYGDVYYISAEGEPLQHLYAPPYSIAALLRLELPVQPSVFIWRKVVEQIGPLSLHLRYSMDSDYWARAALVAPFRHTPQLIAYYRLHDASKTVAQSSGFYADWLGIVERFFASSAVPRAVRAQRAAIVADIYSAMANIEARQGNLSEALRFAGFACTLAGPRPRMAKLPLSWAGSVLPFDPAAHATQLWGRLRRLCG